MKTKKKLLSLIISALLTIGLASVSTTLNAERKSSAATTGSDSDKRSANDSGVESHQKMTICHVPPGNPANAHTIHISSSAWAAHDRNHPGDYVGSCGREISKTKETITPATNTTPLKRDWTPVVVASSSTTPEKQHVVTGCAATYNTPLRNAIRDYYEPIIVPDTALDDPTVAMAVSQCLDNGDSSDSSSGKNKGDSSHSKHATTGRKVGGQGQAHDSVTDSVSDSGNHHRKTHYIRGCQNKDTVKADSFHKHDSQNHKDSGHSGHKADSHSVTLDKNHAARLRDIMDAYMNLADSGPGNSNHTGRSSTVSTTKAAVDAKKGTGFTAGKEGERGTHVSDSAMDDSGVKSAVKACAKKAGSDKIDSSKIGKKRGDSGHKYRIVKSCGISLDNALDTAIRTYKAKPSTAAVVFTDTALNDATIASLYNDCLDPSKGGGKDTVTPTVPNVSVSNATIADATLTNRTVSGATVTEGQTVGTKITPVTGSTTVSTGVTITGTGGNQVITAGTTTGGAVSTSYTSGGATVTAVTTEGIISGGSATGGSISNGVITTATSTSTPVTNATITAGSFTGGSVTGGTLTGGEVSGGTATPTTGATVTTTGGTITGGTVTGGTTTGSGSNAVTTGATVTGGTVTGGTTTGLTITGGIITGVTQTGATIAGSTVSGAIIIPGAGTSGQINWREISQ